MTCNAYRQCDQMVCVTCNLTWDVDDKDRPACNPVIVNGPSLATQQRTARAKWKLNNLRNRYGFKRG